MTYKALMGISLTAILIWPTCRLFAADAPAKTEVPQNTLSDDEKKAGWILLFDGKTTEGWRSYGRDVINPGWTIVDGTLSMKSRSAGTIITAKEFDSFDLTVEYKLGSGGDSGIMFHVAETRDAQGRARGAAWSTGPEINLLDSAKPTEPWLAGWILQLYQPPDDPKTGKPLDATKPAGQWNLVRLLQTPKHSELWINGVKYYEFVKGSEDWNARVAKSKFATMANFGKPTKGHIALQGDHDGEFAVRNVKLRPMPVE